MNGPSAKRVPPPEVPPVTVGDLRIEAVHFARREGFDQNGGILRATHVGSGREAWTLKLYETTYDPRMESDVQDVFIASIRKKLLSDTLVVTDENGRRFTVDPKTQRVTAT